MDGVPPITLYEYICRSTRNQITNSAATKVVACKSIRQVRRPRRLPHTHSINLIIGGKLSRKILIHKAILLRATGN